MRLIKIPDLEYEQYEKIRDAIYSVIPFALLNQQYSKKLKTGFFNFWDVAYIPDELKKYIVQPPLSRENFALLHEKMLDALKIMRKKINKVIIFGGYKNGVQLRAEAGTGNIVYKTTFSHITNIIKLRILAKNLLGGE